ncbi:TnsA endonuclease N-terminal domain-containing protein [Thalassotalea sp. Y01]|uniref:TnsA endonuclease N-terminal domain-containing protein n=1 Tax=Thalassotalea sp. Y01 TaxID=2729613 RepID=UPI00145D1405|nr:TnsA endonuclease N-terminal domain-containing protein [Thalassotalea sp. Y01]NMP16231.1 hypothetical protein [Thalassotalea sp. Y01]
MSKVIMDLSKILSMFGCNNVVPDEWQKLLEDDVEKHQAAVTVHNFSSRGRSWRIKCKKLGLVRYFESDLEYKIFRFLEEHPKVRAIREQFAHPLEHTTLLAEDAGINHPPQESPKKVSITTDFIVDIDNEFFPRVAIYAKYAIELENPRTIEKLLLEAISLASANIPLWIITEREIEKSIIKSFEWIGRFDDSEVDMVGWSDLARYYNAYLLKFPDTKLTTALFELDKAEGEEAGTSIGKVKELISLGFFNFDFRKDCNFLKCRDMVISTPWENSHVL